jgi:hypothetical protein
MLPKKPNNWFPKLSLLLVPLALNYLATLWLPSTAGTPSFPTAVLLTKLLTLAPLVLPAIAPASWGTAHADPRDAYPDITKLFNIISAASALLHAKTTLSALLYNLPGSYKHRHALHIPFDIEKRSKWERTATAVEKVLGSMTDHPVVAAAGKDALLSALSLGLWAAVRSTDVRNMLRSLYSTSSSRSRQFSSPSDEASRGSAKTKSPSPPLKEESAPAPPSMTLRRRGRSNKTSVSSFGSFNGTSEDTTTSSTPATAHQTPKRGRGRPRKVKPEPEPEPEQEQDELGLEEGVPDDKTYQPTPAVQADVRLHMGDVMADDVFDWEPAALAWGLTALGGLGLGSAAVFGAECLAR